MNLIVNKMVELKEVHNAYGYGVVKLFTRSAVGKYRLTVLTVACLFKSLANIGFMRTVKYRRCDFLTELAVSKAEMNLKHLTDVHSGGYAEGVKKNVKRSTVIKERHILLRKYS